jgi:hypothetical protein
MLIFQDLLKIKQMIYLSINIFASFKGMSMISKNNYINLQSITYFGGLRIMKSWN